MRSAVNAFALNKKGYSVAEMLARGDLWPLGGSSTVPLETYSDCLDVFSFWFPVTTP